MDKDKDISGSDADPVVITETSMRDPSDHPEDIAGEIEVIGSMELQVLLLLEDPPSAKTIKVFEDLMMFFQVLAWSDLKVFGRDNVSKWFKSNHTNLNRVIQKRLGYIVEYARHSVLHESTTMCDIMAKVTGNNAKRPETIATSITTSDNSLKTSVPNIEKFSGIDEDYYT